jgi:hypothetical protein
MGMATMSGSGATGGVRRNLTIPGEEAKAYLARIPPFYPQLSTLRDRKP